MKDNRMTVKSRLLEILEHILDLYLVQKKYFMDVHYIY